MRVSSLGTLQSGLAMPILTSTHMSLPLGSEMCMSAVWTARASRTASWLSLGKGIACSDVAMAPVVLAYSTKKSLDRLCRISLARLAHQATCRPMASSGALHGCLAPGSCLPHRWPAPGDAKPNLRCNPHLKGPFATLVNGAVGSV